MILELTLIKILNNFFVKISGTVNNGFLAFDNVRVPFDSMLIKNSQLLEDGTFIKKNTKLNYGTMMYIRVGMVGLGALYLGKSCTIATRYSLVRRQSPINPDEPEPKIIEHVTQQYKIFPAIAKAVVFKVVADNLMNLRGEISLENERGNLERLPELHATICCLKAVCSFAAKDSIETCRLSAGGHGYLNSAGFHENFKNASVLITGEGENTVLLLQTGRFLLKAYESAKNGEAVTAGVRYIAKFLRNKEQRISFDDSIRGILKAVQTAAAGKIASAWKLIDERKKYETVEQAMNLTGIEITKAARLHGLAFLLKTAIVELEKAMKISSEELRKVLNQILELFAVDLIINNLGEILMFVNISNLEIEKLQKQLEKSLEFFRTAAIGIVDGFDFSDEVLNSTLGSYDGNVYERLFEAAKKSPLNQEEVNKSFDLYLKPFMKSNL
jgi:acyl-CoA oxidase